MRSGWSWFALPLIASCTLLAVSAGCASQDASDPGGVLNPRDPISYIAAVRELEYRPPPATLVVILNPSRRAEKLELLHLADLINAGLGPRLTLLVIFEQRTADDGAPFDRPLLSTQTPALPPRAALELVPPACSGTDFQRGKCDRRRQAAQGHNLAALESWRTKIARNDQVWIESVVRRIDAFRSSPATEEALDGKWNLRAPLLRAGQAFLAVPSPVHCVLMLGGLAVLPPPPKLPTALLDDANLVAAGWQGIQAVQNAWREIFAPVNARINFLPGTVTNLRLVDAVRKCLNRAAPA